MPAEHAGGAEVQHRLPPPRSTAGPSPVVTHDPARVLQLRIAQQDVPGVGHREEVAGSPGERALIPSRFFDVNAWRQFSRHRPGGRGEEGGERKSS